MHSSSITIFLSEFKSLIISNNCFSPKDKLLPNSLILKIEVKIKLPFYSNLERSQYCECYIRLEYFLSTLH